MDPVSRSLFFYIKQAHVGVVPGIQEYAAEFTSDAASGEDGYLLAHHVGRDGDGEQADEIGRATGEAELHGPAGARIWQGAGVIAKQLEIRART